MLKQFRFLCRYPKVGEVLTRCTIGASVSVTTVDGIGFSKISGRYAAAFCGQLGPIYLFDDAMSAEQAKGVFSLGPDYMYSFLPSEVGYVPENISTDSIINEKDGLAFKMVFGYNAQVWKRIFTISNHLWKECFTVLTNVSYCQLGLIS